MGTTMRWRAASFAARDSRSKVGAGGGAVVKPRSGDGAVVNPRSVEVSVCPPLSSPPPKLPLLFSGRVCAIVASFISRQNSSTV